MAIITTLITDNGKRREIKAFWRGYKAPKLNQAIFICNIITHQIFQGKVKGIEEDYNCYSVYEAYIAEEPEKGRDRGEIIEKKTQAKQKKLREPEC